jgi:hypothetical protein
LPFDSRGLKQVTQPAAVIIIIRRCAAQSDLPGHHSRAIRLVSRNL